MRKVLKSKFLKNCLSLFLITAVAGLILAAVNEITSEPIEKAESVEEMSAYSELFANAEFEDISQNESISSAVGTGTVTVDRVLVADDEKGNKLGFVVAATSPNGYGGDVSIAVGITNDGKISGLTVLSQDETAGLGAKCESDDFKSQFKGKVAGTLSYIKDGDAGDSEIDAISGATITTKAVTEAVNAATDFYNNYLKGAS